MVTYLPDKPKGSRATAQYTFETREWPECMRGDESKSKTVTQHQNVTELDQKNKNNFSQMFYLIVGTL